MIALLRISHSGFVTMRFTSEGQAVESGGETYEPRWFEVPLPSDADGQVESSLDLDVTGLEDGDVNDLIELSGDFPVVEVDLVLASDPETVEATFYFQMRSGSLDESKFRAALRFEPFLAKPFPGFVYDASSFPDLFL
jgi:hypothetical protein